MNRVSTAAELTDAVPDRGVAPPLPTRRGPRGGQASWRPEVISWWADIWTSPMAGEYLHSDIHGLYLLADLLDRYWRKPSVMLATEIRLQRQCFGLTPIDRRRLQWEVTKVSEAERRHAPSSERERRAAGGDPRDVLKAVS